MIDIEVRLLVDNAYERTKALLIEKREQVEKVAKALLKKEILFKSDLEDLIGLRPYEREYDIHKPAPLPAEDESIEAPAEADPAELTTLPEAEQ